MIKEILTIFLSKVGGIKEFGGRLGTSIGGEIELMGFPVWIEGRLIERMVLRRLERVVSLV